MPSFYSPEQVEPVFCFDKELQRDVVVVEIKGYEYLICQDRGEKMWSSSKTGPYGEGLLREAKDPFKTGRIGKIGEMAQSKITNLPMDIRYIKGGDKTDFFVGELKIDVKTAARRYGAGLVRKITNKGIEISLKSSHYVFAYVEEEIIKDKYARVVFVGWATQNEIKQAAVTISRKQKSKHYNYDLPYTDSRSIRDILNLIRSQRPADGSLTDHYLNPEEDFMGFDMHPLPLKEKIHEHTS